MPLTVHVAAAQSMRERFGYSNLIPEVYDWLRDNLVMDSWEVELYSSGADLFFAYTDDAVQFKLAMSEHYAS